MTNNYKTFTPLTLRELSDVFGALSDRYEEGYYDTKDEIVTIEHDSEGAYTVTIGLTHEPITDLINDVSALYHNNVTNQKGGD